MKTLMVVGLVLGLGACGAPTGPGVGATFSGTISDSQGGVISGATVTVTPTGGVALASVTSGSDGTYTVSGIPKGDGTVVVTGTPSQCDPSSSVSYTGAQNGGHRTVNFNIACNSAITLP